MIVKIAKNKYKYLSVIKLTINAASSISGKLDDMKVGLLPKTELLDWVKEKI